MEEEEVKEGVVRVKELVGQDTVPARSVVIELLTDVVHHVPV